MVASSLFAMKPGTPVVLQEAASQQLAPRVDKEPRPLTVVRPLQQNITDGQKAQYLVRFPKTGSQLRERYTLSEFHADDLQAIGTPDNNLMNGSLFPSKKRPLELQVEADFVTCTQ